MEPRNPEKESPQTTLWRGASGEAWVAAQTVLDTMFQPFADRLVQAAIVAGAQRVLDIGCGTGSSTLVLAQKLGLLSQCLGVDVSDPMLAVAQARQAALGLHEATFIRADAQRHLFEPAHFDLLTSRFGVMFFDDPVQAFQNLRRAAKPGTGGLHLQAWRSAEENPFMGTAERAAAALLPKMPVRQPGAPGQFAFADGGWVGAMLAQAGWVDVRVTPLDVTCEFAEQDLPLYLSRLGPLGLLLQQELDAQKRQQVILHVRAAFQPFVHGDAVRFNAACWQIEARAPAKQELQQQGGAPHHD